MEINVTEYVRRIAVVQVHGRVDAFTGPMLRTKLNHLFEDGVSCFVVDLQDVVFLDSAGITVLVSLLRRTREVDGDVRLVWPSEDTAKRILRMTKFDRVFVMAESVEQSLQSFGG